MSQNVKYTEYTIISNTNIPNKKRVAVFKDIEKDIMLDYIKFELSVCAHRCYGPMIIMRETMTKNFHEKVGGFKKQTGTRLRRIVVWDEYNRGLFGWLNYPCKSNGR
ncbi:MAG: hypothetical protein J6S80_01295 [Alphaproteobacteria bacterium]|nr:hypothetical protein [Alphaproteobacteria bacterium]